MGKIKLIVGLIFFLISMQDDLFSYCVPFYTAYDLFFVTDSAHLTTLYKQLFPASFTAQMYQNMERLIYVNGEESLGLNTQIASLMQNDCAIKFLYTNGQPTFQFCIMF